MTRMRNKTGAAASPWELQNGEWIATDRGFLQRCRDEDRDEDSVHLKVGMSDKTQMRRFFKLADEHDCRARVVEVMKVRRRGICRVFLETGPRGFEETMNFTFRGDTSGVEFAMPPETPEPTTGSLRDTKRLVDLS